MKTDVLFEKKDSKLIITFDKNAEYLNIRTKLAQVLSGGDDTFSGIIGPIIIRGRRFLSDEETEIKNMISEKTELEIKFERPKQMGLATIDNIVNQTDKLAFVVDGSVILKDKAEIEAQEQKLKEAERIARYFYCFL